MDDDLAAELYRQHELLEKEGNKLAALSKLEEAAALGAVYAIHDLAYEYYNQDPPRVAEAIELYKLASSKGDFVSAWNLARHFELSMDVVLYKHWLKRAAELGMEEAAAELISPFPYIIQQACGLIDAGEKARGKAMLSFAARNGSRAARDMLLGESGLR